MRRRSPDWRWRHQARPSQEGPASALERTTDPVPQSFQVSVNILEARKLVWANQQSFNSYVIVILGKNKYRTNIRKNMEDPVYDQQFTFEMYMSIQDIERLNLWFAVMEPRLYAPPRIIGEASIGLGQIWSQPQHREFHKWASLRLPRDPEAGTMGYLKVDIAITCRSDNQVIPEVLNDTMVKDNLPNVSEQQPANYIITIFGAFGIPNGNASHGDRRHGKLLSTFVKASFCGLTAKTTIQNRNNHPIYNEQISFVEMFPNANDVIKLEMYSVESNYSKAMASTFLKLGQISHGGVNGFLPTFGPSLLHTYGSTPYGALASNEGPFHRGSLLVSLKTIVPYYRRGLRSIAVEPVIDSLPDNLWTTENFCIFCPILEVSMLDLKLTQRLCGVAITLAELPNEQYEDDDFTEMRTEIKANKFYYTGSMSVSKSHTLYGCVNFEESFPVLQLAIKLPDFRFRLFRNNMIQGIANDLETRLTEIEDRLKNSDNSCSPSQLLNELNQLAEETASKILKFLEIVRYWHYGDDHAAVINNELDQKQLEFQKDEIGKILNQILNTDKYNSASSLIQAFNKNIVDRSVGTKKDVKRLVGEMKTINDSLRNLIFKTTDGWPYVIVWLLNAGSRFAYYKMSLADIIYSQEPEQNGKDCGKIKTLYLTPLKCPKHFNAFPNSCYCIAGKVELLFWMGLYRQKHIFESYLPKNFDIKQNDFAISLQSPTMMILCRIFIYSAKLNDSTHSTEIFVRIHALNEVRETKAISRSVAPIWNQTLKIYKLCYATPERTIRSPPEILVEVCDSEPNGKSELIGRVEAVPVVTTNQDYAHAPRLQWCQVYKGDESTGHLLMSVQLVLVPEIELNNVFYNSVEAMYMEAGSNDSEIARDIKNIEDSLPLNLIPQFGTYKIDVYMWGLRNVTTTRKPFVVFEINDIVLKSDMGGVKKGNFNFPNGKLTATFEGSFNDQCPSLKIQLNDNSTFGRTMLLGSKTVRNPKKFLVKWVPKAKREASLQSSSIYPSNFFQVNRMLFVKKSPSVVSDDAQSTKSVQTTQSKKSFWKSWLCGGEPNEEEYALLPLFSKSNKQKYIDKDDENIQVEDWWTRYYLSTKDSGYDDGMEKDQLTIYKSELEAQPEYFKFKDWCSTFKLFNGEKTGVPEKDEQILCGILKAGIAIYRWPPPEETVAVSLAGVNLSNGFFNNHPENEPMKFLVRVYVVRGVNLIPKAFDSKLDPYIAITCGNKHLEDRRNYVKNSLNPVFGKLYEFRCSLPDDYLLTVSICDYDANNSEKLVGSTVIDLEDRIYTKHRAMVGLSNTYKMSGPNKWRDCFKPSTILENLCIDNNLPSPIFLDSSTVIINGVHYKADDGDNINYYKSAAERKENICLDLLHKWQTMPLCGHCLVPEHVETRTLYNNDQNKEEQGKLEMWVDIFPLKPDLYIPLPVNITPQNPEEYELRVVIWNVQRIKTTDHNKPVSRIFIRAWMDSIENAQYTDVHHILGPGESNIKCKMVFHFLYRKSDKKMLRKETEIFTQTGENNIWPILVVQMLNYDVVSLNDFLGSTSFNLNSMPDCGNYASKCSLNKSDKQKKLNLFTTTYKRGWWPLVYNNHDNGMKELAGVIDLELHLIPRKSAILMPVGVSREASSSMAETTGGLQVNDEPLRKRVKWHAEYTIIAIILLILSIIILVFWSGWLYNHIYIT